jgi:hypothetical protein
VSHRLAVILLATFMLLIFCTAPPELASAEEVAQVCRGENVTISVILLQNGTYGNPVANQEVEFFDETNNLLLGITTTDSLGRGSIIWEIPLSHGLGFTTVNATFRGNDSLFLAPTSTSVLIHIMTATAIYSNVTQAEAAPGDSLSLLARLVDDEGTPISGVSLHIESGVGRIASMVTNSTGFAEFDVECNATWLGLGENNVSIVFEGDEIHHYAPREERMTIQMQRIQSAITEAGNPLFSAQLGASFEYRVQLLSSEGPISSSIVTFVLDGDYLGEATTNDGGNCSLLAMVDARFTLGPHLLTAIYDGSERYSESNITTAISIVTTATLTTQVSSQVVAGSICEIEVGVTDTLGRPIPDFTLALNDTASGICLSESLTEGLSNFKIRLPIEGPLGSHLIRVRVFGSPFVEDSASEFTIEVWSQPLFDLVSSSIAGYAWPGQNIVIDVQLSDHLGPLPGRELGISIGETGNFVVFTDDKGVASLSLQVPLEEMEYSIIAYYSGNPVQYENESVFHYSFIVTRFVPTTILLQSYEVVPPLKQISVRLCVIALNGSTFEGIQIRFFWLSLEFETATSEQGEIGLHLVIPNHEGTYYLNYSIIGTDTLIGTDGALPLSISTSDILLSEGLGIPALLFALIASTAVVVIPASIKRFSLA